MDGAFWNNHWATYNYDKEMKRVFKLRFCFSCREFPCGMFPSWTLTHIDELRGGPIFLSVLVEVLTSFSLQEITVR